LADRYPIIEETEAAKIAAIAELPPGAGFMTTHKLQSPDRKNLVQLGASGFSVNSVAYVGFDQFRSEILRVLQLYAQVAEFKKVERLGLRYINFVNVEQEPLSGLTMQLIWPDFPDGTPQAVAARIIVRYADPPGQLAVAVGSPDPKGTRLDFDFFSQPDRAIAVDEILSWTDRAHLRIYDAFRRMVRSDLFASWENDSRFSEVG
jgi:uncharacterized protein (TIGR04255 family)